MSNKFLYFAYGSNMLMKRIHINNPTAIRKDIGFLKVNINSLKKFLVIMIFYNILLFQSKYILLYFIYLIFGIVFCVCIFIMYLYYKLLYFMQILNYTRISD